MGKKNKKQDLFSNTNSESILSYVKHIPCISMNRQRVVVFTNAFALQEQCGRPKMYSGPSPVTSIREHHAADDVGELITEVGTWAKERGLTKLQVASISLEQAGHTTLLIVISWYKIKSSNLKKKKRTSRPHKTRRITLYLRSFHPWLGFRDKFSLLPVYQCFIFHWCFAV